LLDLPVQLEGRREVALGLVLVLIVLDAGRVVGIAVVVVGDGAVGPKTTAKLKRLARALLNAEPSGKSIEETRRMGIPSKVLETRVF
jgi:hypothetical protein